MSRPFSWLLMLTLMLWSLSLECLSHTGTAWTGGDSEAGRAAFRRTVLRTEDAVIYRGDFEEPVGNMVATVSGAHGVSANGHNQR